MTRPAPFAHLGQAIRLLRTRAGWQQGDLAEAAGLTQGLTSKYERDVLRPNVDSLEKLMIALGIDTHDLAESLDEVRGALSLSGAASGEADPEEVRLSRRRKSVRRFSQAFEQALALDRATRPAPFAYLGAALRLLRTRAAMQQGGLAESAGLTTAQVSRYERDLQKPNVDSVEKLLIALGTDVHDLADALDASEIAVVAARAAKGEASEGELRRMSRLQAVRKLTEGFERFLLEILAEIEEGVAEEGGG